MKKITLEEKKLLLEEFKKYLIKNKLKVDSYPYSMKRQLQITNNVKDQELSDFLIKELLEEHTIASIVGENNYIDFLNELYKNPKTQKIALWSFKNKAPSISNYNYRDYFTKISPILSYNNNLYFEYVNNGVFLFKELQEYQSKLENIVEQLNSQEKKVELIKTILNHKAYIKEDSLHLQTLLFNVMEKHINATNKVHFKDSFPKINTNVENINFITNIKQEEIITVKIDIESLNSVNLSKKFSMDIYFNRLKQVLNLLEEDKNSLNVSGVLVSIDNNYKSCKIQFIGTNLIEEKIKLFTKELLTKISFLDDTTSMDAPQMLKDALIFTSANYLEQTLNLENVNKKTLKRKI